MTSMDYEKLYKAYYLQVYSYTISLAKNREIAEEITQNTSCTTAEKALDPDANYTENKGDFEIPVEDEPEETGEEDTEPI